MRLKILNANDIIPSERIATEAASRGVEVLVINHLRAKNNATKPNRYGLPKSNYYADASKNVSAKSNGRVASVEIDQPGLALHLEGGTVYPKKKALAIPVNAAVAGIWPSELASRDNPRFSMFWPKGSAHGMIRDNETNRVLWLLVPHVTIPADPTVLPTDGAIIDSASSAIMEAFKR